MSLASLSILVSLSAILLKSEAKTTVYLAGIFPMTGPGWLGGKETLPSIELALEALNNSTELLPNHEVKLIWRDSMNSATRGMREFFDLVYNDPVKVMMIGPATSRVSVHVGVAAESWNLVQISFAAKAIALEDRDLYPFFYRTNPAENYFNPVRMALLNNFGWTRVASVYQMHDANVFSKTMDELYKMLINEQYTVLTNEGIGSKQEDVRVVIKHLKAMDARIILGNFFFTTARQVFCEAYKQDLIWPKHVWIIPQWMENWWLYTDDTDCTKEELYESQRYHLELAELVQTTNKDGALGLSKDEFANYTCSHCSFAFDAIVSAGHVLHKVHESGLPLENFTYDNASYSAAITRELQELSVNGMSGPVGFDSRGNRLGQSIIYQSQDTGFVQVGIFDTRTKTLDFTSYPPIVWHGNKIPKDRPTKVTIHATLSAHLIAPMVTFAVLGIAAAIGLLAFNVYFRNVRLIKLSSPKMNNMIILGSILAYISVILNSLDEGVLNFGIEDLDIMCSIRLAFLIFGYSMAFGAMFSKTWRVHRILASKTSTLINNKMKDLHLALRIMVLLIVDVFFLIVWLAIDPLKGTMVSLPETVDENDVDNILEPYIWKCTCKHEVYWMGAMLVYKGVLLLFGIFLAWETRNIRVEALNDSKHIGLCVYNVAVICIIGVPLCFILGDDNFKGAYLINSIFVILCTTVTLSIVFLPKIYGLYKNPSGDVAMKFETREDIATTTSSRISHSGNSKVAPLRLQAIKENISIQWRLEKALKEKDSRIKELETALNQVQVLNPASDA